MWGIMRSTPYITRDPVTSPPTHTPTDEIWMLSGMSSKNEIPSITPAAKQSMLHMYASVGRFNTPIRDPMMGPSTEIMTIRITGLIALFSLPF